MEPTGPTPPRPDPILSSAICVVALLAGLDALVGLWAVRTVHRSRTAPDISDIDGEFFDPHGVVSLMALAVAAVAVAVLPLLLASLSGLWRKRRRDGAGRTVVIVLALGGVFWAVAGVLALRLDATTAGLFDPAIGGPKGRSLLTPLGYVMVLGGVLSAALLAALARSVAGSDVVRRAP